MARQGKSTPVANASTPPAERRASDAASQQGDDAACAWIGPSLASLTGVVQWLEQLQSLTGSMLSGWGQILALCSRDLERACDPEQVMAPAAQRVNLPLEQASRQLVQSLQDLFVAQASWADPWRMQLADQMQRATGSASDGDSANGDLPRAPIDAIGRFQDPWLAMTRTWIDAMSAAASAHLAPSGR